MKREILTFRRMKHVSGCCPGHDDYPTEKYRNNRSTRARSRDKKKEHRHARRVIKMMPKHGARARFNGHDED